MSVNLVTNLNYLGCYKSVTICKLDHLLVIRTKYSHSQNITSKSIYPLMIVFCQKCRVRVRSAVNVVLLLFVVVLIWYEVHRRLETHDRWAWPARGWYIYATGDSRELGRARNRLVNRRLETPESWPSLVTGMCA